MIPYHDENETQRPAYVTMLSSRRARWRWVLVQGAGVSVALATSVCNLGLIPGRADGHCCAPASASRWATGCVCLTDAGPQYANVFTSMFLHGGWMHLIGNMWFLWLFGNNVEDSMTRPRFLVFYLLCGVAAALAQVAGRARLDRPDGRRVGRHQRRDGRVSRAVSARARLHAAPARLLHHDDRAAGVGDADLLDGAADLRRASQVGSEGGVAFWAHLGGFVAGVVLISLFAKSNHILAHAAADYHPQWGRREGW